MRRRPGGWPHWSASLPSHCRRHAVANHTESKLAVKKCTRKADYLRAVERTREYIAAGDIFQAVISQRFEVDPGDDPFAVYRALRIVNPSPYMYFLRLHVDADAGGAATKPKPIHIVGSSPELLVRVKQRQVEYRPIAGTRPRCARTKKRTTAAPPICWPTRKRSPSTSCWWTSAATTSAASATTAACA